MSQKDLEPGMIFGRDFRVVKALQAGGMGAVYIVDQISTGKQRALKVMAPELTQSQEARDRFVLEARVGSRIESDHVVEVVTAGIDPESGAPYLVMELLRGEELYEAMVRLGPLPMGDVVEVLTQVGHGLARAHAQGIVHRDLKPENIFISASRRKDAPFTAKILDFGVAKLFAETDKTGTQPLGTPLYMAPEQTDRKGRINPTTDVWALGLIAFTMLTGRNFWFGIDGSLSELLREVVVDPIPLASARAREMGVETYIPPGFDAWFARCVTRDQSARFQEAGAAVEAFAELAEPGAKATVLRVEAPALTGRAIDFAAPLTVDGPVGGSTTGVKKTGPRPGSEDETVDASAAQLGISPEQLERAATARTVASAGGLTGGATPSPLTTTGGSGAQAGGAAPAAKSSKLLLVLAPVGAAVAVALYFLTRATSQPTLPAAPTAGASSASAAAIGASAIPAVSASAAASPTKCPDGMQLIPGGKMFMGARDLNEIAKPPHEVAVSAFCLDKTEVTTAAYMACASSGECERPLEKVQWPNIKPEQVTKYSQFCNASHKDRSDHPINCVAWPMADLFCKKRSARLPTEAEWEFAARGSSQRKYPWGDDLPDETRLNACDKSCETWSISNKDVHETMHKGDDGFSATSPVGSFPKGASAHGVLDMAGNVWEWTADWYAPYAADPQVDPKGPSEPGDPKQRVLRGGDFFSSNADWARPAYRWKTDPETYNHAIGFRCAADAK